MSLEVEVTEKTLRYFDKGSSSNLDPFKTICIARQYGETVILDRAHGEYNKKDIFDTYRDCKDAGHRWILVHRHDGGTIPLGKVMPEGLPFAGWIYVDLEELK